MAGAPRLRVTGFDLLPVRATVRTVWLIVRLRTDVGLIGLGEASDAFGFANTTQQDAARMEGELRRFFDLVEGKSPFEINTYLREGGSIAAGGSLVAATAFSAIEQALWDLAGKALGVPVHTLLGKQARNSIPVYANVNRAAHPRTPAGFAAAARGAVQDGFRAVKAAPFDGFPPSGSPAPAIEKAVEHGIACVAAMREAIGPQIGLMVDCHSFFDVPRAEHVARSLEPQNLTWYEEPLSPALVAEMREIRRRIQQPLAGGEILYGVGGFAPLCESQAVDVIMPDVKHCGGIRELTRIAALADQTGIAVAPHNPSGPIATAASVQVCAVLNNLRPLEFQWGEVPWRPDLVIPAEQFQDGAIQVPDRPGLGIALHETIAAAHPL